MNQPFSTRILVFGIVFLATCNGAGSRATAQDGVESGISFLDPARRGRHISVRPIGDEVMRQRFVEVDFDSLDAITETTNNRVHLQLFDDVEFIGIVTRRELPGLEIGMPGSYSLSGELEGVAGGYFDLVIHKGLLAGSIFAVDRGDYRIHFAGGPLHEVRQIDSSQFPVCATAEENFVTVEPIQGRGGDPGGDALDDGSRVDVMIVYTPDVSASLGSETAAQAESILAFTNTNSSFANSLVNTQLFLVHLSQISYTESGNSSTDLGRLRAIGDGFLDTVHTIRDGTGADMVSLFVNSLDACGRAYLMCSVSPTFEDDAFSVCHINCVAGNLTFAHELGHNFGSNHDRINAGCGAYIYSYGWVAPSGLFRTVMAYPSGSTPRVMNFSNPDVLISGEPTGKPEGFTDSADNAKSLNNTKLTVANFRQHFCPNPIPTFDCIANCIEDADDVANETSPDCNSNGIPDECDLFNPSLDCDQNGVPDECEDCNNNGIGDACEFIEQFDDSSSQLSPIGLGADVNYVFLAPPQALGDVTIDFLAIADLGGAFKYLNLTINGADYFRVFDDPNTQNCPLTPDTDQLIIPMAEFNTLLGSGDLTFDLVADGPLPFPCNGSDPWVSIDLSYAAPAAVGDVNENGIPDECDYARGDNNLDGVVDVNDLLNLLAKWGLCAAPCTEDTDLDGDVDVDDLLSLLAGWG